jgi:hypothetical protein
MSQFGSFVIPEFQKTVATASRSGIASSVYGTPSSQLTTRLPVSTRDARNDIDAVELFMV